MTYPGAPDCREAPGWAKELVLTDWVSMACTAPIIAGLTVYVVYLWQMGVPSAFICFVHAIRSSPQRMGGLFAWHQLSMAYQKGRLCSVFGLLAVILKHVFSPFPCVYRPSRSSMTF